jgi:hypothetical protein
MTSPEPLIQLPQSEYLRLLTAVGYYQDDYFDRDIALEDFQKAYEDESDFELERKRAILRNRILTKIELDDSKQRYEILTTIIKANMRRSHAFEREKEIGQWIRMIVSALLGGLVVFLIGHLHV